MADANQERTGRTLGAGQDEILALADGRRTARDLAFVLGSGVYATTLRLAEMHAAGLLVTASERAASRSARHAGRSAAGGGPESSDELPRRGKRPALPRRASAARAPLGLLRPRSGRDENLSLFTEIEEGGRW